MVLRGVLTYLRTASAALRILLLLTVIVGVAYPLAVTGIARLPGLGAPADGSLIRSGGTVSGSTLIGQGFVDAKGNALPQYFQSRPSAAGGAGYDPTASGASNLGPESVVDTLPNPAVKGDTGKPSLLTQVCARSLAVGQLDGVDGSRPFCTPDGVGAVLAVFWSGPGYHGIITRVVSVNQVAPAIPFLASYHGVRVEAAVFGQDYAHGQIVPVRGSAPAHPVVPADAVTASGSGLDPDISRAYAAIQEAVVARTRHVDTARGAALGARYTAGRDLGFLGEARVDVLDLNRTLDVAYPVTR